MRLIFVRHAEPNYDIDSLTEKGFREAALLGERAKGWEVQGLYVSCLGRARRTAEPIEKALGKKAVVLDWLQEFRGKVHKDYHTSFQIPWDFMPKMWTEKPELYEREAWLDSDVMKPVDTLPSVKEVYLETCRELDKLLESYGYVREGNYYRVEKHSDDTLVLVCHMGITCAMVAHLLGISFPVMVQGCFLPPSSVSVLNMEEREGTVGAFRCQSLGDVWHLHKNGEPISDMGSFAEPFQG